MNMGKHICQVMVMGKERIGIKISFITDTRPTPNIKTFIKGSGFVYL